MAVMWADPSTNPGAVLYHNDGNRMIIEYRDVTYLGGGAPFTFQIIAPRARPIADDYERSVLSDFILGREMPFPVVSAGGYGDEPLTFEEREKVRLWIKSLVPGGAVPECGGCGVIPDVDASTRDASLPDAGASDASDAVLSVLLSKGSPSMIMSG